MTQSLDGLRLESVLTRIQSERERERENKKKCFARTFGESMEGSKISKSVCVCACVCVCLCVCVCVHMFACVYALVLPKFVVFAATHSNDVPWASK